MTTTTDIVNRALQMIGTRTTVTDAELAGNLSNEAIQANICLQNIRQDTLRMAPWNFSVGSDNLVLIFAAPGTPENPTAPTSMWLPGQPLPPWLYEYAYPADCLRALYVLGTCQNSGFTGVPITTAVTGAGPAYNNGPPNPFKVQYDKFATPSPATVILTNQQNATLYYIEDVTNPDLMDTLFQSAWTSAVAATLCMALTGDKRLANSLIQIANKTIADARTPDGNEGLTIDDRTPDWIAVRGWGADSPYAGPFSGFNWGGLWPTW